MSHLEVAAAIVRRGRQGGQSSRDIDLALVALNSDARTEFDVVEFSAPLMLRAMDVVYTHGLRAADAIQLASALLIRPAPPLSADFYFLSADTELNAAATAEGLQVENPNNHP